MLRDKVNEYNFKTSFHKAKAAIYISGKRKGKSEKEIMQDMKDYFAKQAAINDINKDRSVRTMSKREQMFNNPIKDETFDIDFSELDDYDSYYDDFSRNNKQVDAEDYDRYYSARFGYGSDSYVDERIRYKMNRNDKSLLEGKGSRRKTYWVYLNGEYIADYKTLRGCLDFIERRKLEYNYDNDLGIIDNEGNEYHPYTGKMYMNNTLRENLSLNENNIKEIKRTLNYNDIIRTIEHITGAFDVTYTQEINDMVIYIYEPDYRDAYICVKVFDDMYRDVYFSEEVKYDRSETCYRKIYNAYKKAVSLCEKHSIMESKRINEWNLWDGDSRSSRPRQTRMIDVADKMRREQMISRKARYNNDPEYHNYIKSLEDELRRTKDPEHAEFLERRISKLRSLSESFVKDKMTYDDEIVKDFYGLIDYLTNLLGVEPTIETTSENWYVGDLRLTKKRINNKEIAKFILSKDKNGMPVEVLSVANQKGYALLQTVHYQYCAPDKFNINPPKVAFKIHYQWIEYRYDVPFKDFIIERYESLYKTTFGLQHTATTLKNYLIKNKRMSESLTKKYGKKNILNEMARKKKIYQVVAKCDYRDRSTEYVCDEFTSKRDALRYMKDECYDTPSRCHIIREIYVEE